MNKLDSFFAAVEDSIAQGTLVKLTLSKARRTDYDYKTVFVKLVEIQNELCLSFVYRQATQDVTKNYGFDKGLALIRRMAAKEFVHADLFTAAGSSHLTIDKHGNATHKRKQNKTKPKLSHDREKKHLVAKEGNVYLRELGVLTHDWKIKKDRGDKFRQINKFAEVVGGVIDKQNLRDRCNVVDMGSGKGYLTFGLYDYLSNGLGIDAHVVGIELRQQLVEVCNGIADQAGFTNLSFQAGAIEDADLPAIDVLIALHACDTATDDAIYRGMQSEAKVIVCAPCCQKQIRKQLAPENDLKAITRYGILAERQAELLTDGIRALILEAYGYRTKVFEFISTEHTAKNIMIVAVKDRQVDEPDANVLGQIAEIKGIYGIKQHYLEGLLGIDAQQ